MLRIPGEIRDAAIGVLHHDEMKLPATSSNRFGSFTDSSEKAQLLQQPWSNSTADVTHNDGLARFDSKYMSRIDTHISATDNDGFYIR